MMTPERLQTKKIEQNNDSNKCEAKQGNIQLFSTSQFPSTTNIMQL